MREITFNHLLFTIILIPCPTGDSYKSYHRTTLFSCLLASPDSGAGISADDPSLVLTWHHRNAFYQTAVHNQLLSPFAFSSPNISTVTHFRLLLYFPSIPNSLSNSYNDMGICGIWVYNTFGNKFVFHYAYRRPARCAKCAAKFLSGTNLPEDAYETKNECTRS